MFLLLVLSDQPPQPPMVTLTSACARWNEPSSICAIATTFWVLASRIRVDALRDGFSFPNLKVATLGVGFPSAKIATQTAPGAD